MTALGRHLLVECYDCNSPALDDQEGIERAMLDAAAATGATILTWAFHKFAPQGVSGAIVIAESHLTIHTWPEYGYAAVDMFTCGNDTDPYKGMEVLAERLGAQRIEIQDVKRGYLGENATYKPLCASA